MRCTRCLIAVAAAVALSAPVLAGTAGAQVPFEVGVSADCDTTTGTYTVSVLVENFVNEEGAPSGEYAAFSGGDPNGAGNMVFSPDPVPAEGTTSAVFSVPGDSDEVSYIVEVDYAQFSSAVESALELDGNCVPPTTTTVIPTTTTTAAPAPAPVSPAFTG